jgi:hypothetical protein
LCLCIVFCERSKLFRKDGNEYKERGIGEMKILYHPEKNTYRLLFRREKVNTKKYYFNDIIVYSNFFG